MRFRTFYTLVNEWNVENLNSDRMVGIIGDRVGQLGERGRILNGKEDEWSDLKFRA
jgi:hypothetical protein